MKALAERALGRADRTREVLQAISAVAEPAAAAAVPGGAAAVAPGPPGAVRGAVPGGGGTAARVLSGPPQLGARPKGPWGRFPRRRGRPRPLSALQETAEAHALLGDLLEAQKRPLEAVAHFRQAVVLDPTPANYFALGYEFLIHWNWEAAARVFAAGLEREPGSWRLWVGAGTAALGLTRYEEATRAFLRAVSLRPAELMGYRLLAQAFDQSDQAFGDAVAFLPGTARPGCGESMGPLLRGRGDIPPSLPAREIRARWRPASKR